jgi:NAD(P)H-flavin reductase/ferredoxin
VSGVGGFRVQLEPLGEAIDCGPAETVLDAAFRQGYNLAYGCREGQCSACKCFLQEGEVELKRYSTFALSDAERANGYALMCQALPESDLVVELLHFDPDNYRLENAIREAEATVVEITELTRDIVGVTLAVPEDMSWLPGQYLDLHVPGSEGERRSYSIANIPSEPPTGRIELMIRRYPGGRFSGLLGNEIESHSRLRFTGPYGAFHLRHSEAPILMVAGGSGMAPVLGVLRQLSADGCERPVRFYYGARDESDLFALDEIARLGERLEDFGFIPVTSRFVHEAIDEELAHPDVYMCGPPPMLDAVQALLIDRGVDPERIFADRFTTSAAATPAVATGVPAPASERDFQWFRPAGRRATLYEDVTVDTQPSIHRHLTRGWPLHFADGRGTWNDASTALRSSDWFAFRDPGQQWERTYYQSGTAAEQQIEGALRSAVEQGLVADFDPEWVQFLRERLQIPAYLEHGLWFALATAARDCLSDTVATCVCLQAAMKQRSAQAIVLYAMDLEQHLELDFSIDRARDAFRGEAAWQPARRFLERLAATADWAEVLFAANLCFEPVVVTLVRREIGTRAAAAHGDTVTPVLARAETQEWAWTRAWTVGLARFLLEDSVHGEHNRAVLSGWLRNWLPEAVTAATALGPVAAEIGLDVERAADRVQAYAGAMLDDAGLPELCALVGYAPPAPQAADPEREIAAKAVGSPAPVPFTATSDPEDGSFDYVGIVMAKSAEGDAVATLMSRREGIEVREQPAFWDIRGRDRLVIPYAEISEELGYAIGAYSIQHEMSTHYGRMVATDDALMLFSDPTEAMEHLRS